MEAMIAVFSKVARYGWRFVFWGVSSSRRILFLGKKERRHNEIGAPDFRIFVPFGIVLTPWDQNLNPVFGLVVTAQEDSYHRFR
jgi:hypothetical protein